MEDEESRTGENSHSRESEVDEDLEDSIIEDVSLTEEVAEEEMESGPGETDDESMGAPPTLKNQKRERKFKIPEVEGQE